MPVEKNIIFNNIPTTGEIDTITKNVQFNPSIPGGNYWLARAAMSIGRGGSPSGFSVDGHAYMVGGWQTFPAVTNSTERYNDSLDSWLSRTAFNQQARTVTASFTLSLSYAGFGYDSTTSTDLLTISAYNESSNIWITKASGTTARRGPGAFSINSYGYVFGGLTGANVWSGINERYSESTNSWSTKNSGSAVDSGASFSTSLGHIAFGGINSTFVSSSMRYNDSLDSWITTSEYISTAKVSVAGMEANGFGHAVGGYASGPTIFANNDQLNDANNSWTAKAPNISAIEAPAGISLNGNGYCVGGESSSLGAGLTTTAQYKNYHLYTISGFLKRSLKAPRSISAFTMINGQAIRLPVQVRTDDLNWKYMKSGVDSAVKAGEVISAVFTAGANGYRNYEARVGIPITSGVSDSGFWTIRPSCISGVAFPAGFSVNGYGFLAGGQVSDPSDTPSTQRYDSFSMSWSSMASMNDSRHLIAGLSLNGIGYTLGGGHPNGVAALTTAEKYIHDTDTWSLITSLPVARGAIATFTLNSFGYSCGGLDAAGIDGYPDANKYNDSTNIWTAILATGLAFASGCGTSIDGNGLITHGVSNTSTFNQTRLYNDAANTWSVKSSGSQPRWGFGIYNMSKRVLISGGYSGSVFGGGSDLTSTDEYVGSTDTWLLRASNPVVKRYLSSFSLETNGYSAGGIQGITYSPSIESFSTEINLSSLKLDFMVEE